jgi:hypothetical protein
MKRISFLICNTLITISIFFSTANAATISLVPQIPGVFVGDLISIDVIIDSADPIIRGALDFTYPSGLVNYEWFGRNPNIVEGSLSFLPNSSTPGILNDFFFAMRSDSALQSERLATMIFNAGSSAGTADFDVFLETIFIGPAWIWGQTGDQREYQPISAADLAGFTLNGTSIEIQAIPIPSTMMLLGGGLVSLVVLRRRSGPILRG